MTKIPAATPPQIQGAEFPSGDGVGARRRWLLAGEAGAASADREAESCFPAASRAIGGRQEAQNTWSRTLNALPRSKSGPRTWVLQIEQ
jgi:hypothetical protein